MKEVPLGSFWLEYQENEKEYEKEFPIELEAIVQPTIIYIFYLFAPEWDPLFFNWIQKYPDVPVIIVEENPISENETKFLERKELFEAYPNVHFKLCMAKVCKEELEAIAFSFPYREIRALFGKKLNQERILSIIQELKSIHYQASCQIVEVLAQERIFKHFLKALNFLPQSVLINEKKNALLGKPAFIIGAGPSLFEEIELLKKACKYGYIFFTGSAISLLSKSGIEPDFLLATCPKDSEVIALKENQFFNIPLLYTSRLNPDCYPFFGSKKGFFMDERMGYDELLNPHLHSYLDKDIQEKPVTVAGIGVEIATHLGCSPIYLVGVDLAYQDGKKYLLQNDQISDPTQVQTVDREGNLLFSTLEWMQERDWLEKFIQISSSLKIISTSKKGLPISGVPYESLESIVLTLSKKAQLDFKERFWKTSDENIDLKQKIFFLVKEWKTSFEIVMQLTKTVSNLIMEGIKFNDFRVIILMSDLENEISYKKIIKPLVDCLINMNLNLLNEDLDYEDKEKKFLNDKINVLLELVSKYLQIIEETKLC